MRFFRPPREWVSSQPANWSERMRVVMNPLRRNTFSPLFSTRVLVRQCSWCTLGLGQQWVYLSHTLALKTEPFGVPTSWKRETPFQTVPLTDSRTVSPAAPSSWCYEHPCPSLPSLANVSQAQGTFCLSPPVGFPPELNAWPGCALLSCTIIQFNNN